MNLLTVLIVMALISTAVTLGWGVISMAHGGSYDVKHGTQLMGARVGLQLLAVVLLFIAMLVQIS